MKLPLALALFFLQRLEQFLQRDVERREPVGIDDDLILFHASAKRADIRHAGHGAQQRAHDVILQCAQLGRVMVPIRADEGVLENFAQPGADRSQLDIRAGGQIAAHALHPLKDQLPREVIIHAIFKDNRDHAQANLRNRAHLDEARQSAHFDFNRARDEFLHFQRRHAAGVREDLHLHRGDIGKRINRDTLPRHHAEGHEHGGADENQQPLADGEFENMFDHISRPPSRS